MLSTIEAGKYGNSKVLSLLGRSGLAVVSAVRNLCRILKSFILSQLSLLSKSHNHLYNLYLFMHRRESEVKSHIYKSYAQSKVLSHRRSLLKVIVAK